MVMHIYSIYNFIVSLIDGCFTTADDNCGNNIVDEGEICDCGRNFDTLTHECGNDPCCNGTSCMLLISNDVQCR